MFGLTSMRIILVSHKINFSHLGLLGHLWFVSADSGWTVRPVVLKWIETVLLITIFICFVRSFCCLCNVPLLRVTPHIKLSRINKLLVIAGSIYGFLRIISKHFWTLLLIRYSLFFKLITASLTIKVVLLRCFYWGAIGLSSQIKLGKITITCHISLPLIILNFLRRYYDITRLRLHLHVPPIKICFVLLIWKENCVTGDDDTTSILAVRPGRHNKVTTLIDMPFQIWFANTHILLLRHLIMMGIRYPHILLLFTMCHSMERIIQTILDRHHLVPLFYTLDQWILGCFAIIFYSSHYFWVAQFTSKARSIHRHPLVCVNRMCTLIANISIADHCGLLL